MVTKVWQIESIQPQPLHQRGALGSDARGSIKASVFKKLGVRLDSWLWGLKLNKNIVDFFSTKAYLKVEQKLQAGLS